MAKTSSITSKRDLILKSNKSIFIVVVVSSIIVSACLIGIKVLWDQRSFQAEVIDAKTDAKETLEENVKAVESLQESFKELEKSDINSQIVLDALPSKYDFPALATSIEKITLASGVTLENFSGKDDSANAIDSDGSPSPQEVAFSIGVKGSYDDITELVSNLNKSIRPFVIESINYEAQGTDGIEATISLKTYYQPTKNLEIKTKSITSGSSSSSSSGSDNKR